jgi:pimeloyl-ACP methyl ester carboxylesterase
VGILSLVILGLGLYWVIGYVVGAVIGTGFLIAGNAFLVFSLLGHYLLLLFLGRAGEDEPKFTRSNETQTVKRPDGTELHVEFYGRPEAQPILFTHGIATNSTDWYYAKRYLADRFRLILWDVTGLGKSSRSPHHDYSLEKMASDLEAVLGVAGSKPVILAGHSMGGMITLQFCKLFPQHLGRRVAGLILTNTTYTNPVKTTTGRSFLPALQKPILVPLLYLIIGLSRLVWLQSWLSYLNGTAYIPSRIFSFAGRQSRGQLDFMTICQPLCSQAVLARQMLGMFKYDASDVLNRIKVPTLIVTSNKDRGCVPEASEYMHQQIPNSELVILAPSGHVGIMEQYGQYNNAVAAFASKVDGKAIQDRVPAATKVLAS